MSDIEDAEVAEIERAYVHRRLSVGTLRYSMLNPGNLRNMQERERLLASALRRHGVGSMAHLEILEIGCGTGGEMVRLVGMGALPANLYGIDLLPDAIRTATERLPSAHLAVSNAAQLDFPDERFDLVAQFTALSSMKSPGMRAAVAQEMARVVRPGGLIVSYDFIWNPRNPDTVGISRQELGRLFPGLQVQVHRVTLAPPLARHLPDRVAGLAAAVPLLRTHLLAVAVVPRGAVAPGQPAQDS